MCILAPTTRIMGVVSGKTKLGNRKMFLRHRQTTGVLFLRQPIRSVHALGSCHPTGLGTEAAARPARLVLATIKGYPPHRNRHPQALTERGTAPKSAGKEKARRNGGARVADQS